MKRREFIAGLAGAAAWPDVVRSQPFPVVGYLSSGSLAERSQLVAAFRAGLSESDHVDGQNIKIDYRWAYNDDDALLDLATDLVRRQFAVIAGFPSLLMSEARQWWRTVSARESKSRPIP
jgi:putative tryptophan/tyrosine transport system substrate-binding protein